jgi:hypothetical protein
MKVTKLHAAQSQLRTAIKLWFTDDDPISTHALAFAAYEVVHVVSKKLDPYRRDLLFDTDCIKEEYRSEFNKSVKRHAYFFKHADRNHEANIDFTPKVNEWLILFALVGRELCKIPPSQEELAFLWWIQINRPDVLTAKGHESVANHIEPDMLKGLRELSKGDFFEGFRDPQYLLRKHEREYGRSYLIGPIR